VRPHVTSTIHLSFALLRDAEGNPSGLVGFSLNITAQKPGDLAVRRTQEVERELQESEAGFVPPVKLFGNLEVCLSVYRGCPGWVVANPDITRSSNLNVGAVML
jgi:hypothetical protein